MALLFCEGAIVDRALTKEGWLEIFGSLKWDNGGHFQLVFEPDGSDVYGSVWLQTCEAEDNIDGVSCMLPHVLLWSDADSLKRMLSK